MFSRYFKYVTMGTRLAMDVMEKLADGILTPAEIVDSAENGIRMALGDIKEVELARLSAITSPEEYKDFVFQPGDVAFVIPAELTDRLKIDLT